MYKHLTLSTLLRSHLVNIHRNALGSNLQLHLSDEQMEAIKNI